MKGPSGAWISSVSLAPGESWPHKQREARQRLWPDVERLLTELPPELFRLAKLLEYDLALRYSDTGQFRDVFLGVDQPPILDLGGWLVDDIGAEVEDRQALERSLLVASFLLVARTHVLDAIDAPDSFYGEQHRSLAEAFARRAEKELRRVAPPDAPGSDRSLAAPTARTIAGAVLARLDRQDRSAEVIEMLDGLLAAFQVRDELLSIHRDLLNGRSTYPIRAVAQAAGIPLHPWPDPTFVLGALVVTASLPTIVRAAWDRAVRAHELAAQLPMPTFRAYLADVVANFENRLSLAEGGAHRSTKPVVLLSEPTVPKALAMARACLLADPLLRESWEVHREGMFGTPEVASRFPAGLVLDILGRHGLPLATAVESFLSFTDANGFRYYDHPTSGVDTDTIGVYLRLLRSADPRWRQSDELADVLGRVEREVSESGAVPVWLRERREPTGPVVIALGEGCGTVAAHLLLGLMDDERLPSVVATGAGHLVRRIGAAGVGANVNYPRTFALAAFFRLLARLEESGVLVETTDARRALAIDLERACAAAPADPQEAALLITACHEAGRTELIDDAWARVILKRQRFDGGWGAEPFAAAPNRGGWVTWYATSTLTTALCYDALARWSSGRTPGAADLRPVLCAG